MIKKFSINMGPVLNCYEVTGANRALQVTLRDLEPDGTRTVSKSSKSQLALFTAERQRALRPVVALSETCKSQCEPKAIS